MPPRRQGAAFVEIVADTDDFEKSLDKSLQKAVKEASKSKNFEPMVKAAGRAGDDSGDEFGDRFEKSTARRFRRGGRLGLFSGLSSPFKAAFEKLGDSAGAFFSEGFKGFLESARGGGNIFANLGRGATAAFASLAETGPAGLIALVAALGAFIAVAPLAVSAFFAIGGAAFSLLGLLNALPASIAILAAAVLPLVVAFGGFGEAIEAIASGDLDKIDEAMKKLSPSARSVAREFQRLQPFLKEFQQGTQEAFFSRLTGSLTQLSKALGPTVSGGFQNVAFALGGFVDQLVRFASRPETAAILSRLFETTARIITNSGPSVVKFLDAIGRAIDAALPSIEKFAGKLGDAFSEFADFIITKVEDGSFQEFLDSAFVTLEKIGVVLLEVLGLFKDMFATTDESGQTFLDDVAEAVRKLREFFQAPEGKEFLENMIKLAEDFGTILVFTIGLVARLVAGFAAVIEVVDDTADALDRLFGRAQKLDNAGSIGGNLVAAGIKFALPKFADGGITSGPSIAGEDGPEAVLPLNDPARARQVAEEANLGSLIGGGGTTVVWVTIDGQQLQGRIDRTVRANNAGIARQLSNGPRGLAVA